MDGLNIDTGKTPVWDLTLIIRGAGVPTLSPLTAADRSIVNLGERRRGALVRAWRWLAGEPRRVVADDHETRQLRHTVAAFVPDAHRRMLASLSGGELLAALGNYVGAQQAWYAEIERAARDEAERVWARTREATKAAAVPASPTPCSTLPAVGAGGVQRMRVPPMKLVPGAPLPAWAAPAFDKGGDA